MANGPCCPDSGEILPITYTPKVGAEFKTPMYLKNVFIKLREKYLPLFLRTFLLIIANSQCKPTIILLFNLNKIAQFSNPMRKVVL